MVQRIFLLFFFISVLGQLSAGPLKLCGCWESEEGGVVLTLKPPGEISTLQFQSEGTSFRFPLTWTATGRELELRFTAAPEIQTVDPFYELTGPPSRYPKRPRKMRYKLAKDGQSLSLDKKNFYLSVN